MTRTVLISVLSIGCGVPVWSTHKVGGKVETDNELKARIESDAAETCRPLLADARASSADARVAKQMYLECVTDYIQAMAEFAPGESNKYATGVN
jgi:hypothetical protein